MDLRHLIAATLAVALLGGTSAAAFAQAGTAAQSPVKKSVGTPATPAEPKPGAKNRSSATTGSAGPAAEEKAPASGGTSGDVKERAR